MTCDVPLPPAIFDHKPFFPFVLFKRPWAETAWLCRKVYGNLPLSLDDREYEGCAQKIGEHFGVIFLRDGERQEWERCALRHEWGHLNGWPASHPDARFE